MGSSSVGIRAARLRIAAEPQLVALDVKRSTSAAFPLPAALVRIPPA
jgi:hypothetical protein